MPGQVQKNRRSSGQEGDPFQKAVQSRALAKARRGQVQEEGQKAEFQSSKTQPPRSVQEQSASGGEG